MGRCLYTLYIGVVVVLDVLVSCISLYLAHSLVSALKNVSWQNHEVILYVLPVCPHVSLTTCSVCSWSWSQRRLLATPCSSNIDSACSSGDNTPSTEGSCISESGDCGSGTVACFSSLISGYRSHVVGCCGMTIVGVVIVRSSLCGVCASLKWLGIWNFLDVIFRVSFYGSCQLRF